MSDQIMCPCPGCGVDLTVFGEIVIAGGVASHADPERKARVDVVITCDECEGEFNAFIPVDELETIQQLAAEVSRG